MAEAGNRFSMDRGSACRLFCCLEEAFYEKHKKLNWYRFMHGDGLACGVVTPLLSSVITGMPPIFPTAIAMMFELAAYGALTGFIYRKLNLNLYLSLIISMLGGRVVSGIASMILYGVAGSEYGLQIFLTGAFVTALPGIILQIVVVPVLVMALEKAKVIEKPVRNQTLDAKGI